MNRDESALEAFACLLLLVGALGVFAMILHVY